MKRKGFIYLLIILCTASVVIIDVSLTEEARRRFPFIWSLTMIPSVMIISMYPKWKVIIGTGIFYNLLMLGTVYSREINPGNIELQGLILDSIINWAIVLTVGYFISKWHKWYLQVEELTIVDSLTGAFNRRYFDSYMEEITSSSEMSNSPLTLIMIDIDHFKKINDNYGHPCGDEVLQLTSNIIKSNIRQSDAFSRFGGEEFAVIMPNTDVAGGLAIAKRMRETIEKADFTYNNEPIHFTISIGVSMYGGEDVEHFIERTDQALYQAKENGRNQIAIAD